MAVVKTFRRIYKYLVPSWLSEGEGGLVLDSLSLMIDTFLIAARAGVEARFPTYAGPSALRLIGRDRKIIQGRSETNEHYAQRLKRWRYPRGHRVRGSAFALLDQVTEYFGGIRCWTIDAMGNLHVRGSETTASTEFVRDAECFSYGNAWDWYGIGLSTERRFWIVLDPSPQLDTITETPDFGDPELWGGAVGTKGFCVGIAGTTPDDWQTIRSLVTSDTGTLWKPAGTRAEWLVLRLEDWTSTPAPAPDGQWGDWSYVDVDTQRSTRDPAFRYVSLSPKINNVYSGKPSQFARASEMFGGSGEYEGDPTSFPVDVSMPDGSTYAGNPASFPVSVQLFDDGSQS